MNEDILDVERLKEGDWQGLETLVQKYYFPAVRAAYLILQDRSQAEDVVQTLFADLPGKIQQYDPRRPFKPWFFRCVVNASLNSVKKQSRLVPLQVDEGEDAAAAFDHLLSEELGPEAYAETQELRRAVFQALGQLSPNQRAVIALRYYLGLNEADIAAQLASPPSSIKWWLHTARLRLRDLLSPFQNSGY